MPCMACSNHKCPAGPMLTAHDFAVWPRLRMVIVEISERTVCLKVNEYTFRRNSSVIFTLLPFFSTEQIWMMSCCITAKQGNQIWRFFGHFERDD